MFDLTQNLRNVAHHVPNYSDQDVACAYCESAARDWNGKDFGKRARVTRCYGEGRRRTPHRPSADRSPIPFQSAASCSALPRAQRSTSQVYTRPEMVSKLCNHLIELNARSGGHRPPRRNGHWRNAVSCFLLGALFRGLNATRLPDEHSHSLAWTAARGGGAHRPHCGSTSTRGGWITRRSLAFRPTAGGEGDLCSCAITSPTIRN